MQYQKSLSEINCVMNARSLSRTYMQKREAKLTSLATNGFYMIMK